MADIDRDSFAEFAFRERQQLLHHLGGAAARPLDDVEEAQRIGLHVRGEQLGVHVDGRQDVAEIMRHATGEPSERLQMPYSFEFAAHHHLAFALLIGRGDVGEHAETAMLHAQRSAADRRRPQLQPTPMAVARSRPEFDVVARVAVRDRQRCPPTAQNVLFVCDREDKVGLLQIRRGVAE